VESDKILQEKKNNAMSLKGHMRDKINSETNTSSHIKPLTN